MISTSSEGPTKHKASNARDGERLRDKTIGHVSSGDVKEMLESAKKLPRRFSSSVNATPLGISGNLQGG